jgi:hypothetical protein
VNRWSDEIPGVRRTGGEIEFPKPRPEIGLQWMQRRIAGHDCTCESPFQRTLHQSRAKWVRQNITAHCCKGIAAALFPAQHMVMGLVLEPVRTQRRAEMLSQEFHAESLIGIEPETHPNDMDMIRHEAVNRAEQPFASRGVEHHFAEAGMKTVGEPSLPAKRNGQAPVDGGVSLVIFARQTRQIKAAVQALAAKGIGRLQRRLPIHLLLNFRAGSRGLPPESGIQRELDHNYSARLERLPPQDRDIRAGSRRLLPTKSPFRLPGRGMKEFD